MNDLESENDFRASDGSKQDFFNWNGPEPNDIDGGEDCVMVYPKLSSKKSSKWNDDYCTYEKPFVCEKGSQCHLTFEFALFRAFRSKD